VPEKIQGAPAVAGERAAAVDIELGALAVQLRFSDAPAVDRSRRIGEHGHRASVG